MSDVVDLYETDFALWADTQARVLRDAQRAGVNVPVDWENVAEEIESLSRTDRRNIRSRLRTIIEHLLKLQFSRSVDPRWGWRDTIVRSRQQTEDLLSESPSLRREIPEMIEVVREQAVGNAVRNFQEHAEDDAIGTVKQHAGRYAEREILGDWMPERPQ